MILPKIDFNMITHVEINPTMNAHPYAMIYYDSTCHTFNEALRKMNAIPNLIFSYQHTVYAYNIQSDLSFASYVHCDATNELLTLRFPKECKWIAHLRNNYNCKMVMHYKDIKTYLNHETYLTEIAIEPSMNIDTRSHHETTIRIYTRGIRDLEIYFDMYLVKSALCKL